MSVINTANSNEYVSQGSVNENFPITFDFNPDVSEIIVRVNDEILDVSAYNIQQSNNGSWSITIRTGHHLTAGSTVLISRSTIKVQPIDYIPGSVVPQKNIISSLDRLTYIVQETSGSVTTIEQNINRVRLYYLFLPAVSRENLTNDLAVLGPRAYIALTVEANRTQKINNDLIISPALIPFQTPNEANNFYYPAVAMPNNWTNITFTEEGLVSKLWHKFSGSGNLPSTVLINGVQCGVWFRRQGIAHNKSFPVVIYRYE